MSPLAFVSGILGILFRTQLALADLNHSYAIPASPVPSISLIEILTEAAKANPDLLSLQAQAEATRLQAETEFYLPPPTASLGSMGINGPVVAHGHMQTSYQLSQQIPFPTKVTKRKQVIQEESQAISDSSKAKALSLQAEIRNVYIDYWKSREMQSLLEERSSVVAAHTRRLKAGQLSSQLMQAHLISAGTDFELIRNDLDSARELEARARARLNALMGRDPFASLPRAAEVPLSPLPASPTQAEIETISARHPEVQESKSRIQAAETEVSSSRSELLPDLMVSYRYNHNTPNAADVSNSELLVGVTLPFLYFWQSGTLQQAAQAKQAQAQAQLWARQTSLRLRVFERYSELSRLRGQFVRFRDLIVPESDRRMKISHQIAPTDMDSLDEHRSATESSVELRIRALNLRADYEKSLAEFEALTQGK